MSPVEAIPKPNYPSRTSSKLYALILTIYTLSFCRQVKLSTARLVYSILLWYCTTMSNKKKPKKESKQVRISLKAYEDIRRRAFKERSTMVKVLEEIIWKEFTPL